jgi:DNA-binding phage protein
MNISDLLKNPNKAKSLLEKALENEDKELAEILISLVKDSRLIHFGLRICGIS